MRQVVAQLLRDAKVMEDRLDGDYERASAATSYWAMLDLKASASFRQAVGERKAYLRAAVFSELLNYVVRHYKDVSVLKELGDGLLLRSTSFRPLAEILAVLDGVNRYWSVDSNTDPRYPSLEYRASITFGEAICYKDDYFGQPIDQVARLCAVLPTNDAALCVVDDEVRMRSSLRIEDEMPFLSFIEPYQVPAHVRKSGERPFSISELVVDRVALSNYRAGWSSLRLTLDKSIPSESA